MAIKFHHRSLKTRHKAVSMTISNSIMYWASDHTSWRFLNFRHKLLDSWRFKTVIEYLRAPETQPKPIFCDENKRHRFNGHITQCPHVLWHGRWHGHWRGQRGWRGTDMADDVVLTWKVMMTWPTWLLTCISAHKFLSPSKRPIKFQPSQTISTFIIATFQPKWHSKFSAHLSELHILGPVYHNLKKQKIQHLRLHSEAHHNSQ